MPLREHDVCWLQKIYRGADKSLTRSTSRSILFDGENISFDASLVISGFGGAEIGCWPLIPKFAGSNPAEAVGFLQGDKNPQHAFLRNGSKIIGQICGM